jgi:hypothetical protein
LCRACWQHSGRCSHPEADAVTALLGAASAPPTRIWCTIWCTAIMCGPCGRASGGVIGGPVARRLPHSWCWLGFRLWAMTSAGSCP